MATFSKNQLIHFVFANSNDTYYEDSMQQLNFEQHLWQQLRKVEYSAVYFLQKVDGGSAPFSVSTFENSVKNLPEKKKQTRWNKWWNRENDGLEDYAKWLKNTMKQQAVIVCPMEQFCEIFGHARWEDTLKEIAFLNNRCGILVLTVPVEHQKQTTELLLTSSVFETLNEMAVTNLRTKPSASSLPKLYAGLKHAKGEACIFANKFTKERVKACLTRFECENPDRVFNFELVTEVLTQYLNNPEMRRKVPTIFPYSRTDNLFFQDFYHKLADAAIWDKLMAVTKEVENTGNLRDYLQAKNVRILTDDEIMNQCEIIIDGNTPQGKCLNIEIPKAFKERSDDEPAETILGNIRDALSDIKNHENCEDHIGHLQLHYGHLCSCIEHENWETYKRALKAIRCCAERKCNEKICQWYNDLLVLSKQYDQLCIRIEQTPMYYRNEEHRRMIELEIQQNKELANKVFYLLETVDLSIHQQMYNFSRDEAEKIDCDIKTIEQNLNSIGENESKKLDDDINTTPQPEQKIPETETVPDCGEEELIEPPDYIDVPVVSRR